VTQLSRLKVFQQFARFCSDHQSVSDDVSVGALQMQTAKNGQLQTKHLLLYLESGSRRPFA